MKNFIRILSFFILCLSTQAQAALITFQVDMTGETVSPNGLHVIANFNGFSPNANLLTETSPGSNLYTVTVSLTTGDNIEYKFINGNDYGTGTVETPPTGCAYAINNNRSFTVPASDETLDVHTLDGCPVGYVMIPVTFCVDMANEDASLGVYLIGDFYGGFGSFLPLSLPAGQTTVYCTTYDIPEGVTRVNYKYTIGNNYDMQENSNTGACANGTDRFFDLTGANPDNSDIYFFNTCTASVLPIELKDFSVRAQKSNVLLTWETSIEMQTDYFLIEQSTDGRNFYPVHKETAAGDSEIEQYYEFTDENAHNGLNYYRLTTYDLDGTTHIEGVRTI